METKANLEKLGIAQAASLSAMFGILTLAFVNLGTEVSKTFSESVYQLGKLWMPGAEGIGPYSGKETISLVVWLMSWLIFHRILSSKEWNARWVVILFLSGIGLATTLLWPPATHGAVNLLTGIKL